MLGEDEARKLGKNSRRNKAKAQRQAKVAALKLKRMPANLLTRAIRKDANKHSKITWIEGTRLIYYAS